MLGARTAKDVPSGCRAIGRDDPPEARPGPRASPDRLSRTGRQITHRQDIAAVGLDIEPVRAGPGRPPMVV